MPSAEIALQKKLAALKRHTERIEAVAEFLIRNPELAARATLKRMSTGTGLCFEEKGYIRPVATAPVRLQLERHIEDWDNEDTSSRIIFNDVRSSSPEELKDALKQIGVDLDRLDDYEFENGDEDD